jgi:hypothetical protein
MLFSIKQKKKSNIYFIYFNQNKMIKRIKNRIFKTDTVFLNAYLYKRIITLIFFSGIVLFDKKIILVLLSAKTIDT